MSDIETLKHNKTKRSKICWDLCVTIAVCILNLVLMITYRIADYRYGLTSSDTWLNFVFFYGRLLFWFIFLFTLGSILFLVIRLAIINFRFGNKRFLLQMTFVIVVIGVSIVSPRCIYSNPTFMQGFYENMKANADIDAIQDWLDSLDLDRYKIDEYLPDGWFMLSSESWPDVINQLSHYIKQEVYLVTPTNNKRYVRVVYGGGVVINHYWSLVVGVGADEIPLDDYFTTRTEERLELAPNAFVGYARRR